MQDLHLDLLIFADIGGDGNMLSIIYLITIIVAFFVFREIVKDNPTAFEGVDFKDLVAISALIVFPLFNILISWRLYVVLKRSKGSFASILKEVFFI